MRTLYALILSVVAWRAFGGDLFPFYELMSYADGKQFRFKVLAAELQKTPAWPADAAHPPLDPRKAAEIARKQMDELVSDGTKWPLYEIRLATMGDGLHWIYIVAFELPRNPEIATFGIDNFRVIVLMDGRVIKPAIMPYPRPGPSASPA
jgi:hypothetical protein